MYREQLINYYLDYINNFLSLKGFAEYYGLHEEEARSMIKVMKEIFEAKHPEA